MCNQPGHRGTARGVGAEHLSQEHPECHEWREDSVVPAYANRRECLRDNGDDQELTKGGVTSEPAAGKRVKRARAGSAQPARRMSVRGSSSGLTRRHRRSRDLSSERVGREGGIEQEALGLVAQDFTDQPVEPGVAGIGALGSLRNLPVELDSFLPGRPGFFSAAQA